MMELLDKFDKSLYVCAYKENRPISTKQALSIVLQLTTELGKLLPESYIKIPHAVSAVFLKRTEPNSLVFDLKFDVERRLDDRDIYLSEECSLIPPESKKDRGWRQRPTRLTYLICQLFMALLTGKISHCNSHFSLENLVTSHSTEERKMLSEFFQIGLCAIPEKRYQNFQELKEALLYLQMNLGLIKPPKDCQTNRNIPNMTTVSSEVSIEKQEFSHILVSKYELQIWSYACPKPVQILIDVPAKIQIGRKIISSEKLKTTKKINSSEFSKRSLYITQEASYKEGIHHYILVIQGDSCLSRKHVEIYLPQDIISSTPYLQDMGSTHGILLFHDQTYQANRSSVIPPGGQSPFYCPHDQLIKIGNTYVRILASQASYRK